MWLVANGLVYVKAGCQRALCPHKLPLQSAAVKPSFWSCGVGKEVGGRAVDTFFFLYRCLSSCGSLGIEENSQKIGLSCEDSLLVDRCQPLIKPPPRMLGYPPKLQVSIRSYRCTVSMLEIWELNTFNKVFKTTI